MVRVITEFKTIKLATFHLSGNTFISDYLYKNGEKSKKRKLFAVTSHEDNYTYNTNYGAMRVYIGGQFIHDGASVPRIAWTLSGLTPYGHSEAGSRPHDFLYRTKGGSKTILNFSHSALQYLITLEYTSIMSVQLSRKASDQVLQAGVRYFYSKYRSNMAYNAVRLAGRKHWGGPCPAFG